MFTRIAIVFSLAAAFAFPATALSQADAERCLAMQATLQPKQAEIAKLKDTRDTHAERVELAGETWQNAENVRTLSPEHSTDADLARAEYDEAQLKLEQTERGLQAAVVLFNKDVAAYNRSCTSK